MKIDISYADNGCRIVTVDGKKARYFTSGCRMCYVYKDIIIKIEDKFIFDHMHQCKKEVKKWKQIRPEDKKYFAPILAYKIEHSKKKTSWVAQRKFNFRRGRSPKRILNLIEELSSKYDLQDVDIDPRWNWAITKDGSPIIFDYAI